MKFSERKNFSRWFIIIISFVIVALILWNTYTFFQIFKTDERVKMLVLAESLKTIKNAGLETDTSLALQIITSNKTIPLMVTNQKRKVENSLNIDDEIVKDSLRCNRFLEKLKSENSPIIIEYVPGKFQYLYYGNSSLLNKLKYYPVALLLIIVLFGGLVYNFYRSTKIAAQNKLWAGMAKETAHQIGTPLSSLMGWLEIMKADQIDVVMIQEIEKDISRLLTIADRFSKIGSEPVLEVKDIVAETYETFEYLKSRFSKQIVFSFVGPEKRILVSINVALHSWTVENLVKNAVDAMKGKGLLDLAIVEDDKWVKILVSDTGKGISRKIFRNVFEPGFTTKKRGWGLGLSLSKRIVEEYHGGKIRVKSSEIGKGTVMEIAFRKIYDLG